MTEDYQWDMEADVVVLGEIYGGAGGTLGPGMTFGYIAGRHLGTHMQNH